MKCIENVKEHLRELFFGWSWSRFLFLNDFYGNVFLTLLRGPFQSLSWSLSKQTCHKPFLCCDAKDDGWWHKLHYMGIPVDKNYLFFTFTQMVQTELCLIDQYVMTEKEQLSMSCRNPHLIPLRASSWAAYSSLFASPWHPCSSSLCGLSLGSEWLACPKRNALGRWQAGDAGSFTPSSGCSAGLSFSLWASCGSGWRVGGRTWRRRRCWWWPLTAAFWTCWFCVQPSWQRWCPGQRTPNCLWLEVRGCDWAHQGPNCVTPIMCKAV